MTKLEDIAKQAGVSRSTVSRVINNEPYVSERTRSRVMAVVQRERFSPNPAARSLVTQRTYIIGVAIPSNANVFFTDNSYFPMMLQGIGLAAQERDYAMLLWLGQGVEERHYSERMASSRLMDGAVIASLPADHPLLDLLLEIRYPLVLIDRPSKHEDKFSYVTVDNVRAAQTAVQHLITTGRKRIAHITGLMTIADGRDRLEGYKRALQKAQMRFDPDLVAEGHFTTEQGYIGMKRLLPHKPDAVFAAGDTTARGAIQAIHEAGLRVPQDIAIVGFDDLDVATRADPPLTTIRQPVQEKGAYAARLLMDIIEGRHDGPQRVLLPTELVIRQSSGAAL